jgi:hypothetical protein
MIYTASMNVYASIVLGCFTSLEIVIYLMVLQLDPKCVGEYST